MSLGRQRDTPSTVPGGRMEKQVLTQVGFTYGGENVRVFPSNNVCFLKKSRVKVIS